MNRNGRQTQRVRIDFVFIFCRKQTRDKIGTVNIRLCYLYFSQWQLQKSNCSGIGNIQFTKFPEKLFVVMQTKMCKYINVYSRHFVIAGLLEYDFYIIAFEYLCRTEDGQFLPVEVAMVEFSLLEGIKRKFHQFIKHGKLCKSDLICAQFHLHRVIDYLLRASNTCY